MLFMLLTDVPNSLHIYFSVAATAAASLTDTVVLSSVISTSNHMLLAGMRILYGLAQVSQAPPLFARQHIKVCRFPQCY